MMKTIAARGTQIRVAGRAPQDIPLAAAAFPARKAHGQAHARSTTLRGPCPAALGAFARSGPMASGMMGRAGASDVRASAGAGGEFELTEDQVASFHREGYLLLEGFASPEEVAGMRSQAESLMQGFDPSTVSVFSTKNQKELTDEYFLESGNNVSFFFEEGAFNEDGSLAVAKELAINKIGHAMHDVDPVFRAFSRSPKMAATMRALGYRRPTPVQSMYICKQPSIGGEVVPHQDNTFLYTDPPSACGLWLALEDATKDNGCLWALPHSHEAGVHRRMTVDHGASGGRSISFDAPPPEYPRSEFLPLEVPAGTLVLLHGSNVHMSYENTSPNSRHAYTMHIVEGSYPWADNNWLQRSADLPFEPMEV